MSSDQHIEVFVNPMKLFEWERDPHPGVPMNPTPEALLRFLCPHSLASDMPTFKSRYRAVSTKDQSLFFSIQESGLVENLFGPLRQAKISYMLGHPYSEELQLTERIRRVGDDTLQVDITFHDPKTYTRDWTGQKMFRLQPTWELTEYVCEDNYTFDEFQTETGVQFVP